MEAVKKDLDELSTAVRTEASNAGAAIAGTLKVINYSIECCFLTFSHFYVKIVLNNGKDIAVQFQDDLNEMYNIPEYLIKLICHTISFIDTDSRIYNFMNLI